jgi:hypothetical protein
LDAGLRVAGVIRWASAPGSTRHQSLMLGIDKLRASYTSRELILHPELAFRTV